MAVELKRCPKFGVTLMIFSGRLSAEEWIERISRLDGRDRGAWLNYFGPTADLTCVDVAHLPALKRVQATKEREIFGDLRPRWHNAIICGSPAADCFFRFWRSYTVLGEAPATTPGVFSSFKTACDWLGLPRAACSTLEGEARQLEPA